MRENDVGLNHSATCCSTFGYLWRSRPYVLRKHLPMVHRVPWYVRNEPVVPLPELGILAAGRVRIGHAEGVQHVRTDLPAHVRLVFDLDGLQLVAHVRRDAAGKRHPHGLLGSDVDHVRDYLVLLHGGGDYGRGVPSREADEGFWGATDHSGLGSGAGDFEVYA